MNIIRIYNQNRKQIWKAIIVIAFFILILQIFSSTLLSNKDTQSKIDKNEVEYIQSTSTIITEQSAVTGKDVSTEKLTNAEDLLDEFFSYCNNKSFEQAYNMLTDECKELIYPTLDIFISNYYNNIFSGAQKIYCFENWTGNIYRVTIEEDVLKTGKVMSSTEKKIDYVTIDDNKLNISTFIEKDEINKESIINGIKVVVNNKETYMDYEIYDITVTNEKQNTICLANIENSNNICIKDANNLKYGVYNHELVQENFILRTGNTRTLKLKFYSNYVSTKKIQNLVFSNVFLDYENDRSNVCVLNVNL